MMKKETESENNEISESYSFVCCNKCQNLGRLTVATELDAAVLICWAGCDTDKTHKTIIIVY